MKTGHGPSKGTKTTNGKRGLFVMGLLAAAALSGLAGCHFGGSSQPSSSGNNQQFFTSGSRDADQQASQKMAESEQLTGQGAQQKDVKTVAVTNAGPAGATNGTNVIMVPKAENQSSLYQRLGGTVGISNIVADFTPRVMDDPRVNWKREGVTRGGLSFHHEESVTWKATPQNVAMLKQHITEFLTLASGGPAHYTGKEIQSTHADMHISNPEFDAAIGDLKATLDNLQVPNLEQKELLSIVESTRPQIVTEH